MEKCKLVSIVCTTFNEERLIGKTIESFLSQSLGTMNLEIIIVDGMSEDNTRRIVSSYIENFPNIKLIDNQNRKNPFGRNIGVNAAKGNYIALLGAHTVYDSDYIRVCLEEMLRTESIGVSGKVIIAAEGNSTEAQLCELILSNKFGVSGSSFRTVKEGYTSMVNFPVFKKEVFEEVGLYDTSFHRNQDNDFNARVVAKGHKLYNTWKTKCKYYPPHTLKKTFSYAYNNGLWNAKSILEKPETMKIHHYVPFIFVWSLIVLAALTVLLGFLLKSYFPFMLLLFVICLHLTIGFIFSLGIKKNRNLKNIFTLPFLFFAFHFSYGWGTLKGFFTNKVQ